MSFSDGADFRKSFYSIIFTFFVFVSGVEGESNMQVEDMDEDSSEEDEMSGAEDEEDASGKDQPTPAGKPLMAVDAAPAVIQPALPTPGN